MIDKLLGTLMLSVVLTTTATAETSSLNVGTFPQPPACAFSGEFHQQRTLSGLPTPLESSGVFFHDCQRGLIWKTTRPVTESLIIDREKTGFVATKTSLAPLSSRAGKMIVQIMEAMLTADEVTLSELFIIEPAAAADGTKQIALTPIQTQLKQALKNITLSVNDANQVVQVKFVDRRGDTTVISMSSLTVLGEMTAPGDCIESADLSPLDCSPLYPNTDEDAE